MNLPNVSLVAFYGSKPPQLTNLILELQNRLSRHSLIQERFIPYQLAQVHSTIIGCEGFASNLGVVNQWFQELRQETRYMNFLGLVNYWQNQTDLPLTIRFGGYTAQGDYHFLSRQQSLYLRSFQLQSAVEQTIPVVIGWSWDNNRVTLAIDRWRRSLQQFNLLHKYHGEPQAVDNDVYLRLGTIKGQLTPATMEIIAKEIRHWLAHQSPFYIPLRLENIFLVRYQDFSLNPETTQAKGIAQVTPEEIEQMY